MGVQVAPIVEPTRLSQWGVPSAFLAQFEPRPIDLRIEQGGTLGAAAIAWKWAADEYYSAPIVTDGGVTWSHDLEESFAQLTMPAASYVEGASSRVDRNGVVVGAVSLVVARYDVRARACGSVTAEIMTLVRDAVRAPLVSWSDDWRQHAAAMVYAVLKRRVGATPAEAGGAGDQNVFLAEDAARMFFKAIGRHGKPDAIIDSSQSADGPLMRYPRSKPLRGW